MARAVATCKCATCGENFEKITFKQNRRLADSWETWASSHFDECDDCREKRIEAEREEESRKAAEAAKEIGLIALKGSEKQIAWAEKIRMKIVEEIDSYQINLKSDNTIKLVEAIKQWVLKNDEARFWIDNRDLIEIPVAYMIRNLKREFEKNIVEEKPETEIVEPEEKKHVVVCKVEYTDKKVTVSSKYDPEMPKIVKDAGFKWDGNTWNKEIGVTTGDPEDRAAEIANKLLVAGFPIEIDQAIRDKAVSGTYEPEWKRWVSSIDGQIKIRGDVDTKGIPGIKRGIAPVESYEAIEEFARLHDYRFTPGARSAIDAHKAKIMKAAPIPGKDAEYNDTADGVKAILDSDRDVLEDLKDETDN